MTCLQCRETPVVTFIAAGACNLDYIWITSGLRLLKFVLPQLSVSSTWSPSVSCSNSALQTQRGIQTKSTGGVAVGYRCPGSSPVNGNQRKEETLPWSARAKVICKSDSLVQFHHHGRSSGRRAPSRTGRHGSQAPRIPQWKGHLNASPLQSDGASPIRPSSIPSSQHDEASGSTLMLMVQTDPESDFSSKHPQKAAVHVATGHAPLLICECV